MGREGKDEYCICFPFLVLLSPLSLLTVRGSAKGFKRATQHLGEAEVSANEQQNLEIGRQFENAPLPFFYSLEKGIWSRRGSELVHG